MGLTRESLSQRVFCKHSGDDVLLILDSALCKPLEEAISIIAQENVSEDYYVRHGLG